MSFLVAWRTKFARSVFRISFESCLECSFWKVKKGSFNFGRIALMPLASEKEDFDIVVYSHVIQNRLHSL